MSFAEDLRKFAEKTERNMDTVVRQTIFQMGTQIIFMSPVGNPDLWKTNQGAAAYNLEVFNFNANLRNDPANLTKAGRLRKGKKLNDGMDIKAPAGYVGGRFRGNWQYSHGAPHAGVLDNIDASGSETINRLQGDIAGLKAGGVDFFTNNLPYARPLEYGHSTQAPAGMVRVTSVKFRDYVTNAVRDIQ